MDDTRDFLQSIMENCDADTREFLHELVEIMDVKKK